METSVKTVPNAKVLAQASDNKGSKDKLHGAKERNGSGSLDKEMGGAKAKDGACYKDVENQKKQA